MSHKTGPLTINNSNTIENALVRLCRCFDALQIQMAGAEEYGLDGEGIVAVRRRAKKFINLLDAYGALLAGRPEDPSPIPAPASACPQIDPRTLARKAADRVIQRIIGRDLVRRASR